MKKGLMLLVILVSLTSSTSNAQTSAQQGKLWQQPNQKPDTLYQQGNYIEALPVAESLLNRQFSAAQPNKAWVSDITYIHTCSG